MKEWTFYTIFFLLLLLFWQKLWRRICVWLEGNRHGAWVGFIGWLIYLPFVVFLGSLSKALAFRLFRTNDVGNELFLSFFLVVLSFTSLWRAANTSGYDRGFIDGYEKAILEIQDEEQERKWRKAEAEL